jgi:hypothetical protein
LAAAGLGEPRSDIVTPVLNPVLGLAITNFGGCKCPRVSATVDWEPSDKGVSSSGAEESTMNPIRLGDVDASGADGFVKNPFVSLCLLDPIQ